MQILHWIWVFISNASFSSWKMIIRTLWALTPTINRKALLPSKICLPATRRLHRENKLQIHCCSLTYLLTNFKEGIFWDHTEVWSDWDSVTLKCPSSCILKSCSQPNVSLEMLILWITNLKFKPSDLYICGLQSVCTIWCIQGNPMGCRKEILELNGFLPLKNTINYYYY